MAVVFPSPGIMLQFGGSTLLPRRQNGMGGGKKKTAQMKAAQYILMSQQEMSAAFICPLHSQPHLVTPSVVNKYEESANKVSVKSCKTA